MRLRIVAVLCLVCLCTSSAFGQAKQGVQEESKLYVTVPREVALPVIASQPDSPLQAEKAVLVQNIEDGRVGVTLQLRNRGTKPVRSFSYALLYSSEGGWLNSWPGGRITDELVMPDQIVPFADNYHQAEIVPLTKELRDKLKLQGAMKTIAVFMVVRVRFADGSTYDDESTYKALESFFDDMSEKVGRAERQK